MEDRGRDLLDTLKDIIESLQATEDILLEIGPDVNEDEDVYDEICGHFAQALSQLKSAHVTLREGIE